MKRSQLSLQLGNTFNENVKTVESRLQDFLNSGDPANTQGLRRALRRLRTSYSVLPRKRRGRKRFRSYLREVGRLSRATGEVRDLDTISARAAEVADSSDWRSVASEIARMRASRLREAASSARLVEKMKVPHVKPASLGERRLKRRMAKRQRRLVKRVDREFDEFVSTQEIEAMHALRKDSKRLRQLLELNGRNGSDSLLKRLRSIQDELGAIRDHDLVIDYLRGRVKLASTRALVREEIARRHAGLEDFLARYRGQGRVVPL